MQLDPSPTRKKYLISSNLTRASCKYSFKGPKLWRGVALLKGQQPRSCFRSSRTASRSTRKARRSFSKTLRQRMKMQSGKITPLVVVLAFLNTGHGENHHAKMLHPPRKIPLCATENVSSQKSACSKNHTHPKTCIFNKKFLSAPRNNYLAKKCR